MNRIDEIIQGMQVADRPSMYWTSSTNFSELVSSQYTTQRNGQTVWDHTMAVIDLLTIKNPITLLSGLFHDLGKCRIQPMNDPSLPRFPGHAIESANIAEIKLAEWQATPYIIDRVIRMISMHMYDISNAAKEKTIRKFIADIGQDNIENWFILRIADSCSYALQQQYRNRFIEPFRKAVMLYLDRLPKEDDLLQLQSEPNVTLGGKEYEKKDMFLSMEGDE
jgi:hypothetical protein